MKSRIVRALTAGVLILGTLGWASPAMAACETARVGGYTIGAGGEPIATLPYVAVGWCGYVDPPTEWTVPVVEIEQYPAADTFAVMVGKPRDSAGVHWVFAVNVNGTYQEVVISPHTGGGGEMQCLVFHGAKEWNPGGCQVFLER